MSPALDLLTKISVAFGLCMTVFLIQLNDDRLGQKEGAAGIAKKLDTPWRYTSMGWQDSTNWTPRTHFVKPAAAQVHPIVWAALIALAALGLMVWSSKEEVIQFKQSGKRTAKPIARTNGKLCDCIPRCKNFCIQDLLPEKPAGHLELEP